MEFKITSIADDSLRKQLEDQAKAVEGDPASSIQAVVPIHKEDRKFHTWELIKQRQPLQITVIHIFPKDFAWKDWDLMMKMQASIEDETKLRLMHLAVLVERIDELQSYCITYLSIPDSEIIAIKFMKAVSDGLSRRIS